MTENKKIFGKTGKLHVQFLRYFLVGGTAFVVDFTTLYILTEFAGLFYILSASISFMIGLVFSYTLSVIWVFNHRNVKEKSREFTLFLLIGVIGLILNALLIGSLTELIGINYLGSKVIAATFIFFFNFSARKFFLFSERKLP